MDAARPKEPATCDTIGSSLDQYCDCSRCEQRGKQPLISKARIFHCKELTLLQIHDSTDI